MFVLWALFACVGPPALPAPSWKIDGKFDIACVAPDGRTALVADASRQVRRLDVTTGTLDEPVLGLWRDSPLLPACERMQDPKAWTGNVVSDGTHEVGLWYRDVRVRDVQTGTDAWSWRSPAPGGAHGQGTRLDWIYPALVGDDLVVVCDHESNVGTNDVPNSLCVFRMSDGQFAEWPGYHVYRLAAVDEDTVVLLEPEQIRAVRLGPHGPMTRWTVPLDQPEPADSVFGAVAYEDGRVVVSTGSVVYVLDPSDGSELQRFDARFPPALHGRWVAYEPTAGRDRVVARDLATGIERTVLDLESRCGVSTERGLVCGHGHVSYDVALPYALVAYGDELVAFPLEETPRGCR